MINNSNENKTVNFAKPKITFDSFGLKEPILKAIREAEFETPSPIQEQVIPLILSGVDVVAQAQTGTGKTAAFGLPALNLIDLRDGVGLLVITPTRELAQQVSDELFRFGKHLGFRPTTIYGGQSYSRQIEAIRQGKHAVVATPGRLLDLLQTGRLGDFRPSVVVLDEADEMLDMGFLEDIQKIFTFLPKERQTLLFSATMPIPIQRLAEKILKTPTFVKSVQKESVNLDITQLYYVIKEEERDIALTRIIDSKEPVKSIIFCGTKKEVDRLSHLLIARGHSAKGLHGDMEQRQRSQVIGAFKSGELDILVATDVAARGLDVADVSHVFNYNIPNGSEGYVHRIGRTGRAGRKGEAITLVTPREFRELQHFLKVQGSKMEQCYVPTIAEVKTVHAHKIAEDIAKQPVDSAAQTILTMLKSTMTEAEASLKLISLLMERKKISGPDSIGINFNEVDKMMTRTRNESSRGGPSYGRRKPPFNRSKGGPRKSPSEKPQFRR
jgi:ATP-dependent RNA helicase DeaD